ncbi:hypothetical protein [Longimicrobium terrae]|uniref:DUF1080 domain-containing protein n=1 Tax=Longimicrobium terrae TaxID=1639882 RepID=A0A841GV66_9BACT|nr:hypothetical protein [Longimicrobium terrae]MBB4634829.1 hypothetical protein [Longimicrobium terrae]MBB6069224.1 hypothetical protein [Longimicrobium terrae]NNC31964.1 hypothetical protein [Longimicrobium terrae]
MPRTPLPLILLALAACAGDAPARREGGADSLVPGAPAAPSPPPAGAQAASAWRVNPREGVTLTPGADGLLVETGPHTVLWPADGADLAPPYTVRATFHKRTGRLHEGYGLVFGGAGLDAPEAGQTYSYFLLRGDGSVLVKRRAGAETPLVRDWTRSPAANRDGEGVGRENTLEARVGADTTVFLVNEVEVARIASGELSVRGRAGLRVAHDLALDVRGFRVDAGGAQ